MILTQLIAGDSLNFSTSLPQYSAADGWVLKYRLVPRTSGGVVIALEAGADGAYHRTQVAASTTATWAADTYAWASWVEKGLESYTVETGQITILPDPRQVAPGHDGRSLAQKALDEARAALATWSPTRRRYRIGGREMEFREWADASACVKFWQGEVAREQIAAGALKVRRIIHTRL
jgi:hypothetical protein